MREPDQLAVAANWIRNLPGEMAQVPCQTWRGGVASGRGLSVPVRPAEADEAAAL